MHLNSLLVLAVAFCVQHVFAVREMSGSAGKSLLQTSAGLSVASDATGDGSSASVTGSATVSGPGSVVVQAEASADEFSVAEASNLLAPVIASAIPEVQSGGDIDPLADSAAAVFAEAIAKAFIEATSVSIVSTADGGSACGQATISPEAAARTTAEALIDVLTSASDIISVVGRSDAVDAITTVTVDAFDDAQQKLCVNGVDEASSSPSELASTIAIPYATVIGLGLSLVSPEVTPLAAFTLSVDVDADGEPVLAIGLVAAIAAVDR